MSELVAIAYPDRQTAEVVRDILAELAGKGQVDIEDAVIAGRDRKGKLKLEQSVQAGRSRVVGGALAGGLAGLLVAIPVLGAAVGVATMMATRRDTGVEDDFAKELASELEPPRHALVMLVREASADEVLPQISEYGGKVMRTTLSPETEAALRARIGGDTSPAS
jgi:uncharacterized membrane protein